MNTEKRPRGRPKKTEDAIESWRFVRTAIAIAAYDEARETGEKHSAAVVQAVDDVRKRHPAMPISETEVKRIHATLRPRNGQLVLRFKRTIIDDEKRARLVSMLEQVPSVQDEKRQSLPSPSIQNLLKSRTAYTFGYFERPSYTRHNRELPNQ